MRYRLALLAATMGLVTGACSGPSPAGSLLAPTSLTQSASGNGFDDLGYNRQARIFNGLADGTDGVLNGLVYGDPTYALDKLVMKWNAAWDGCNDSPSPENCAGAWTTNEWNGKVPGGSGEIWHYKIEWVGACGADGTTLPDGGYCIWGAYEVIFSQGTVANQQFWDAHAINSGFGG